MTLDLPPTLIMPYTWGMRALPIVGVALVMVLLVWIGTERLGLPDTLFWGAVAITILLAVPLWRWGQRSLVEASAEGVRQHGLDGEERFLAWADVSAVDYQQGLSLITLYDSQNVPQLRFTTQRNDFFTFTLLLAHYCPHVWRLHTPKQFRIAQTNWFLLLLVIAGAVRTVWVAISNPSAVAILVALGFVGAVVGMVWWMTGQLTIERDGIVMERQGQKTVIPFQDIATIGWTLRVVRRSRYYAPTITRHDGTMIDLSSFGSSVILFCTLVRAWLDARQAEMTVRWGAV